MARPICLQAILTLVALLAAMPASAEDAEALQQRLRDLARLQLALPKPGPTAPQLWQLLDARLAELQVMAQSHEQELRRCRTLTPACETRLSSQRAAMQHTAARLRTAYEEYGTALPGEPEVQSAMGTLVQGIDGFAESARNGVSLKPAR